MRRREILAGILGLITTPTGIRAQKTSKSTHKIGVVTLSVEESSPLFLAFATGLKELGYQPGKNISIEFRYAAGRVDRLSGLIADVMAQDVDVLVVESIAAAILAKNSSQTMPIVVAVAADPVGAGVFTSLARPGGNATGLTLQSEEIIAKRIQFLREVLPRIGMLAVLYNQSRSTIATDMKATEDAAKRIGIEVQLISLDVPESLSTALAHVTEVHPQAIMSLPDGMLLSLAKHIGKFAIDSRLPGIFPERDFVESGGLMSYGPSLAAHFHRAATFVDKILKGARPAELPVEQPTKFELVINLKTAKALGLTIPATLLVLADEVIE
jgi:putative tryptophan/tyrosine transport system substrate-binding protein